LAENRLSLGHSHTRLLKNPAQRARLRLNRSLAEER